MGIAKGTRKLKSPSKPAAERATQPPVELPDRRPLSRPIPVEPARVVAERTLEKLLPGGRVEENREGRYFVVDTVYPLHYEHGHHRIETLLSHSPSQLNAYLNSAELPDSFRSCLFIDTETTGLAGAGTIAFMIGVGFFEEQAFVVRQYFARDFDEEPAMLYDLAELVQRFPTLISFNGRTFDIPLLTNRYTMNRMLEPFYELPHIDLLHPARRVWRRRLGSVALGELEQALLGIGRSHEDVPGYLIPTLYHAFVRNGDPREMVRVFYHNKLDIISMATLAHELLHLIAAPDLCSEVLDLYSLGRWQADLNLPTAEAYLRQAAAMECETEVWHDILLELGRLLKRNDRRADAVPLWQQVGHTTTALVEPHIELAKFYEWHEPDLTSAMQWTERALEIISPNDQVQFEALTHRYTRLLRKSNSQEN